MPLIEPLFLSIIAGFVGTIAMTISQEIELRYINKRPISFSPALAVFKILRLDFERLSYKAKVTATYIVHFGYGTAWGFPLALFYFFEFRNFISIGIFYFLIILLQGWIVFPLLGIAGPPWSWGTRAIVTELIHKAIYTMFVSTAFMILLLM